MAHLPQSVISRLESTISVHLLNINVTNHCDVCTAAWGYNCWSRGWRHTRCTSFLHGPTRTLPRAGTASTSGVRLRNPVSVPRFYTFLPIASVHDSYIVCCCSFQLLPIHDQMLITVTGLICHTQFAVYSLVFLSRKLS